MKLIVEAGTFPGLNLLC